MIKVLMCGNHPSNKGGMTSVISQLRAYEWEKNGIKMKFIPTFYPANNIVKAGYFGIAYLKIAFSMIVDKTDIVHMHMSYKGSFKRKYLIHRLCKFFGVKDIIHLHGSEFEKWYCEVNEKTRQKIRTLLKECDNFFVLGEKWENVIKGMEPSAKTTIVMNAVSIPECVVQWNQERCQILYMGVLIPRKGLQNLLEAILKLKQSDRLGRECFAIAGSGEDETRLKEFCRQHDLEDIVRFYGWTSGEAKIKLMRESQISILPSYNEGLPISILEAISYGMPVISTDVGDISSAVKDQINGYLVRPGDVEQLAEKLELLNNQMVFEQMSKESRILAEQYFSEDKLFETIQECYIRLGGKSE